MLVSKYKFTNQESSAICISVRLARTNFFTSFKETGKLVEATDDFCTISKNLRF